MKPKKIYWTVSLFLLLLSCIVSAFFIFQPDYDMQAMNALPTTIRFERDTLQLGTIRYGEKRKVTFRFTITFDPNSLGHFLKNIDIVCNIDSGIMKLKLCGNVIE